MYIYKMRVIKMTYTRLPKDIKNEIYLDLDIDDLANACVTDKESIVICSSKLFWQTYFKKHNLPVPDVNNYVDWIDEFYIAREVKNKMDKLENEGEQFKKVNINKMVELFYHNGISYEFNDDFNYKELFINNPIDKLLTKIINKAYDSDLSISDINVKLKYEPDTIIISKNMNIKNVWKLIYELYDTYGDVVEYKEVIINKNQATKYLNNVIYLELEEN